ncbi:hypothetical protein NYE24_26000 [Paenibacillus sp. FSL H7-0350]|uniref:hypothetical protein n=1 Tax=Paenibacillus sp. FSL H7-0350 TaxID=2975345 RepID=UPI0031586509
MRQSYFVLICGIVVLSLLTAGCSKDTPQYNELFTQVEKHRAVFKQPLEEGLTTLGMKDAAQAYDTTLGILMLDEKLTVNQKEFIQQMTADITNGKITGYRIGTVFPRSDSGYEDARELVRAFLNQYKPVDEAEADNVEESLQSIDGMTFPLKPLTGAVEESWTHGEGDDKLFITYRMANSFDSDKELPLNLYFSSEEQP